MTDGFSALRIAMVGVFGISFAALANTSDAAEKPSKSIAGDPSCGMMAVEMSAASGGTQSATGVLTDESGTLVRDGVAAIRLTGKPDKPELLVIDARWVDPEMTSGPDIEIVRCEETGAADAEALLPKGVEVKQTGGIFGNLAQWLEGKAVATAPARPRRLDRGYDRKIAEPGEPGRSRAALTINGAGGYVVLIGGASPGTRFAVDIVRTDSDRPAALPLSMPVTRGTIDSASPRQNVSLRPYALHEFKVDAEGPAMFRGTASVPMYLEVGDVADDAAFDWFGLHRSATSDDREVERLVLWRAEMVPGKETVFGLNLKPGSYFVRLRGLTKTSFGDYSVAMTIPQPAELLRIPDPEPIKAGITRGNLVIGESFSQDANGEPLFRPTKLYQFIGKAGTGYEVRLESEDIDLDVFLGAGGMLPLLRTANSGNQVTSTGDRFFALLANNDHPNVEGMKRKSDSCLFFVPQKQGPVVLKVIGSRVNQAGNFTLTVTEQPTGCLRATKD